MFVGATVYARTMSWIHPRFLLALVLSAVGVSACDKKDEKRDDKKAEKRDDKTDEKRDDKTDEKRDGPGTDGDPLGGPVTDEVTLLRYSHWADAPDFCRTPTKLLAHLEDKLSSDECDAQRVTLRGREQLVLNCFVEVAADDVGASAGCKVEYAGTLRPLLDSGSEADYTLVGQGNLSRVCTTIDNRVRTSAAEATDIRIQSQAARRLKRELQPCNQP
jgi:hypothetical protein